MIDLTTELELASRAVHDAELDGAPAHVVTIRRALRGTVEDAWSACTDPDRVVRWFLPLTGELRVGGRYQLEGNAGGIVLACEPPSRLEVTWECGDLPTARVELQLEPVDHEFCDLVLRHTVPDDDQWATYGPGAVGVGWELPVAVLAVLVGGDEVPSGAEVMSDPAVPTALRRSAAAWGQAHAASGVEPIVARDAATATAGFYAPAEAAAD